MAILTFTSAIIDSESGVSATVDTIDADTQLEFTVINTLVGVPKSMSVKIQGTLRIVVDFLSDYIDEPFTYTAADGTLYNGVFVDGTVNFDSSNLTANIPAIIIATENISIEASGIDSTNTHIVFKLGATLLSHIPGRAINGFSSLEVGQSYWILPKIDWNLGGVLPAPGSEGENETFTAFESLTESPDNTFTSATNNNYAIGDTTLSGDGFIMIDVPATPSNNALVALDDVLSLSQWFSTPNVMDWQYGFYIRSGDSHVIILVADQNTSTVTDTGIAVAAGDKLRISREGTAVTLERSVDDGATWTVVHSYAVASGADLKLKVAFSNIGTSILVNPKILA